MQHYIDKKKRIEQTEEFCLFYPFVVLQMTSFTTTMYLLVVVNVALKKIDDFSVPYAIKASVSGTTTFSFNDSSSTLIYLIYSDYIIRFLLSVDSDK